ncbi:2'-5' RNA ligase family protein [Actinoplanes sp. NPDC049118]|uniref:2'-5' RNA ligase family protein n=1 Tax=Actinoplanes sp. NPDC049118 TaxID=3155769 RepID=UPI00340F07CB
MPVPQVEQAVGRWRAVLDRAAGWGVPAHVTVLYPFLAPEDLDEQTLTAVAEVLASVPPFTTEFAHVRWFGDTVVWLAPSPDRPFRALTDAIWQRFPQAPPYAGAHTDVVPHLTIGHDAPRRALAEAADAVAASLPIRAPVDVVRLIAGTPRPDGWHTIREFPIGG